MYQSVDKNVTRGPQEPNPAFHLGTMIQYLLRWCSQWLYRTQLPQLLLRVLTWHVTGKAPNYRALSETRSFSPTQKQWLKVLDRITTGLVMVLFHSLQAKNIRIIQCTKSESGYYITTDKRSSGGSMGWVQDDSGGRGKRIQQYSFIFTL